MLTKTFVSIDATENAENLLTMESHPPSNLSACFPWGEYYCPLVMTKVWDKVRKESEEFYNMEMVA